MVLVGFGLALAFSAMSGSMRLTQKAFEHEAAMLLARAKLDEIVASSDYEVADDLQEDFYAGTAYGYKIEVRPLPLLGPAYRDKVKLPFGLDEVTINVYWGPQGAQQVYSLTAYRYNSRPQAAAGTPPAQNPPPQNPPPPPPGGQP